MRKSYDADTRYFDERNKLKIKCKICGHTRAMPSMMNRILCNHCGNYIFRTNKDEFEYRMKEKLKNTLKN